MSNASANTNDRTWWQAAVSPLQKLAFRLRAEGIGGTIGWAWYQVYWRVREQRLGVATDERAFGVTAEDDGENHCYEAIDSKCFELAMDWVAPSREDAFFDYGCGKGRALCLAAQRTLRRIEGLERDPHLAEICRRNVNALRRARCRDVRVVEGCATSTPLPDDVTIVFMFNPFSGHVLQAALEQIRSSWLRHHRVIHIIYVLPNDMENLLDTAEWLTEAVQLRPGYLTVDRCIIYRTAEQPPARTA